MASGPSLDFATDSATEFAWAFAGALARPSTIFGGRIAGGSSLDLGAVDVRGFKHMFDFRRLKLGGRRAASPLARSSRRIGGGPFLGEVRPLRQLLRSRNKTIDAPRDRSC